MRLLRPLWWNTLVPWRALDARLPVSTLPKNKATGLVVHRQGQYGWNKGNWVDGDPNGYAVHYGLDIIGWAGASGLYPLQTDIVCCSSIEGVVAWVGPDEHGNPSINLRHSPRTADRRRFSFFGDLEVVFVKAGQSVSAGEPLGRPCLFHKKCRFFHFGMGYEIRRNGKWQDVFIDPGRVIPGHIEVRPTLPWTN